MSLLAIAGPDAVAFTTHPSGDGFSPASEALANLLEKSYEHFREPAYWIQLEHVLSTLSKVFEECFEENWDGYNARPISFEAYEEARRFVELLPSYIPLPEVVPEPTGEIGLEWYKEKQYTFVISVSGCNIINYAGIFGEGNKTHGTEEFFSESIPPTILQNIRRLFS